ncbi:MAG: hypothetical protein KME46_20500 [Brasilonema angustatum HA4187-MV1]|jgi:hypothetical protein|nr:hypothetical protein [Brasilonema angustatum HA4187-MV1]
MKLKKKQEKSEKMSGGGGEVEKQVKMTIESSKIQNSKSQIAISNKYY